IPTSMMFIKSENELKENINNVFQQNENALLIEITNENILKQKNKQIRNVSKTVDRVNCKTFKLQRKESMFKGKKNFGRFRDKRFLNKLDSINP
ncbi:20420_t:CDS:1, partial [Dentiscutata erythropus]